MGALVVLYNWYRIRERSRRVDEKKRTSVVDVRPNQNINKRFSKDVITKKTAEVIQSAQRSCTLRTAS